MHRTAALVASVLIAASSSNVGLSSQAPASRLIIIASDLHLGPGRDPQTGRWLPIEDFRWHEDFASFLNAIDDAGQGATDLVLNGDTFDLWESTSADCRQREARLGCTEAEALERLERVLSAHAVSLAELGAFARRGTNRVVLVPGDRDAALLVVSVAARVLSALNAPGRVEVAPRGYWVSEDGLVYVEHGHQIMGDPYGLTAWPEPFVQHESNRYLERSWGEQLVQAFYSGLEPRYPIIDNFAQDGAGLKYLVTADPAAVSPDRIGPLLSYFLMRPAWQQFRQELDGGDVEPPQWDLDAVRRTGAEFFAESLLPDDRFLPLVDRAMREGGLSLDVAAFMGHELIAICDYRAALRRSRRRLERSMTQAPTVGPAPSECPRTPETRGSAFQYFWRSRDALFASHLEQVQEILARDGRAARSLEVFVHGHTHLPAPAMVPARGASSPAVLNSGAWQRTVTPFQLEAVLEEHGWSEAELLRQFQPEDLPACYGVVWIDPYAKDNPAPRLRFWRPNGTWGALPRDAARMATACGSGGTGPPL